MDQNQFEQSVRREITGDLSGLMALGMRLERLKIQREELIAKAHEIPDNAMRSVKRYSGICIQQLDFGIMRLEREIADLRSAE